MGPTTFYSDSDAPALDLAVQRRLHRLDPNLRVTWSKWEVHPQTSFPLLTTPEGEPIRVMEPDGTPSARWHLWSKTGDRWYYVRQYKEFGLREVRFLEADDARFKSPLQIFREGADRREKELEEGYQDFGELRGDVQKANRSKMEDTLDLARQGRIAELGTRQGLVMSFPGQTNRSTPGLVTKDPKEDGWEVPQRKEKRA